MCRQACREGSLPGCQAWTANSELPGHPAHRDSLKLVAGLQSFGVPAHPVGMHLMEAGGWMVSTGVPAHPVAGTPD